MTIKDLYDACNNLNFSTKISIVNTEHRTLVLNRPLSEVFINVFHLKVESFQIVGNEVIVWVQ